MIKRFWFLIIILFVLIAFAITGTFIFKPSLPAQAIINGKTFNVELAQTSAERAKGLAGRDNLDNDAGMLFIFPIADIYAFWMKDALIPLDILWIDNGKVVEMTTLQPPNSADVPKYTPKNEARYVLELKAGTAEKYGVKVGDEAELKF